MNEILLIIIASLLFVLVAVLAYNMFQEKHYRNKIRNQFGHADGDALLGSQTQSVRDGRSLSHEKLAVRPAKLKPSLAGKKPVPPVVEPDPEVDRVVLEETPHTVQPTSEAAEPAPQTPKQKNKGKPKARVRVEASSQPVAVAIPVAEAEQPMAEPSEPEPVAPPVAETPKKAEVAPEPAPQETGLVGEIRATFARMLGSEPPLVDNAATVAETQEQAQAPAELLIPLEDLQASRLPWFDERADYMAYVSLHEALELPALPRFSSRYRFQMVGCTMDGLFQPAEPIPGVMYQAFAIGLQAISRNGLASERDLEMFAHQVRVFAESMDGEVLVEDREDFLQRAQPLDELCARVDQTIAIHLVSRISILGIEIRSALEDLGFQLLEDGTFGFADVGGEVKYTVVTLDGSRFTANLLATQPYKGFSMLFDITRVPHGESNFDEFMNLAVRLSSVLGLELVDDQIQQLSTDWLKEVRTYVLGQQKDMLEADIMPGGSLAQRLFA